MKEQIDALWNYNYWANRRILARAETLTQAQLLEKAPYMGDSILRTMAHVMGAEWLWRQRIEQGGYVASLNRDQFTTLELLKNFWVEEEAAMRGLLAGLNDAGLERVVESKNSAGQIFRRPVWQILTHVVNHGSQHRSEVALYLTNLDRSPGEMDFMVYIGEQDR